MRKMDRGSRWSPNVAPSNPDELPKYLFNELTKLGRVLFQVDNLHLDRVYKVRENDKPRDGDIELCDVNVRGTKSGLYYYKDYDDKEGGQWWFITGVDP
jgi:hypothetical protein